jgi:ribosomal protein S18 acetylase RimI-like enzyme
MGDESVGYLSWEEPEPGNLHIVDIAVMPQYRGRGIGAAVLAEKLRHCTTAKLHVDPLNRAQTLYHRLGFRVAGQDGPLLRMDYTRP